MPGDTRETCEDTSIYVIYVSDVTSSEPPELDLDDFTESIELLVEPKQERDELLSKEWLERDRELAEQAFKMEERRRWSRARSLRERFGPPKKKRSKKRQRKDRPRTCGRRRR